jgi:hypothetical protein
MTQSCSILAAFLLALTLPPAAAQTPTVGVPDVANGDPSLFAGHWSVIRPGATETLLTCMLPTVIETGDGTLAYIDIGGRKSDFTVSAGEGQTLWVGSEPQTAVWTGLDSFILYPHLPDGALDIEYAALHERCEIWPRKSYEGAVPGAVEPFAGRWAESLPAERGAGPSMVTELSCDNPTIFTVASETSLEQIASDGEPLMVPVTTRDGETIFPFDNYPQTIIWISPDRWHLHGLDIDRQTDWNVPVIFTRCP